MRLLRGSDVFQEGKGRSDVQVGALSVLVCGSDADENFTAGTSDAFVGVQDERWSRGGGGDQATDAVGLFGHGGCARCQTRGGQFQCPGLGSGENGTEGLKNCPVGLKMTRERVPL